MSDKMHDDEARIPLTVSPIPILVCLSRSSRRHFDPDSHVIVVLLKYLLFLKFSADADQIMRKSRIWQSHL